MKPNKLSLFKQIVQSLSINIDLKASKTPALGRWGVHGCDTKAALKADLTNEDHCGVCDKMRYDYIDKTKK
tara:strand:+ start:79 stop:291 length:213 start_codon:yes stop_codon:yes gene_type:complete